MRAAPPSMPYVRDLIPPDLADSPGWRWLWDRLLRPVPDTACEDQTAEHRTDAATTRPVRREKREKED